MSDAIDHKVLAVSRLLTQFREAANLIAYIESFATESNELETVFQELLNDRWIDTAEGEQLDIIGDIVGQSRIVPAFDPIPYFGFLGSIGAGTFGTLADSNVGEVWRTLDDKLFLTGVLTDEVLRVYIRAKVRKNNTNATIEDVADVVSQIVTTVNFSITEGSASFNIDFDGVLTDTEKLILTRGGIVPRPAGVSVTFSDTYGFFA